MTMATDPGSLKIIAAWLATLADLCATGGDTLTKNKLAALSLALAEEWPSGAFTSASARHCAMGSDFFPGFDSLTKRIGEWWRDHKPQHAMLTGPSTGSRLTPEDQRWVDFWHARRPEVAAADYEIRREGRWFDESQLPLARLASLIRTNSPRAWAEIAGAAPEEPRERTDAERAAVREIVANLKAELRAPPLFSPPMAADQLAAIRAGQPVPQFAEIPASRLAAMRDNNPLVQRARALQREIAEGAT